MKRENLISYSANFASFVLDSEHFKDIDRIILFGSVARGNFDVESDIDIFIDTKKDIEKGIEKLLNLFNESEIHKKWTLRGLKNSVSVKVGDLQKWNLKRDVISDGIILYGKFKDIPEKVEYYLLVKPSFKKFNKSKQVMLWRKLYGYKQRVGKKVYETIGLLNKLNGIRLDSVIIVPVKNKNELLQFLNKEKIPYTVNEIWSDNLGVR